MNRMNRSSHLRMCSAKIDVPDILAVQQIKNSIKTSFLAGVMSKSLVKSSTLTFEHSLFLMIL